MSNYDYILKSLKFTKISDNVWRLDEVLDNDILNYTSTSEDEEPFRYYIYKPNEPPAAKFITITITTTSQYHGLEVHFNYGDGGQTTRVMRLTLFDNIFTRLLQDKRDNTIKEILK